MEGATELSGRLRDRILNDLHLGTLRPGDRLPSIRALWREMGTDHRVVAHAYRLLEEEGLVEVRGRSGVYVARQDQLGGVMLAETARWMAGVLVEGWKRHIAAADLPGLIRRCTTGVRLRCACVESNADQMVAYCTEMRDAFGVETVPVYLSERSLAHPDSPREEEALERALRGVDVAVTTAYHQRAVRPVAERVGVPVVTLTVHPVIVETVQRRLATSGLTVVAADTRFGDRIRAMYAPHGGDHVRVVMVSDDEAVAALDPEEPVLLTRAARQHLVRYSGAVLLPHSPTLSPGTVRDVMELVIRLNVEAETRSRTGSRGNLSSGA